MTPAVAVVAAAEGVHPEELGAQAVPVAAGGSGSSGSAASGDPNSLIGPAGFGSDGFITSNSQFPYRIDFENEPTATAQPSGSTSPINSTQTSIGRLSSSPRLASAIRSFPSRRAASTSRPRCQ